MTHQHSPRCLVGGPLAEYGCGYQHETRLCTANVVTQCECEHGAIVELAYMEAGIAVLRLDGAIGPVQVPSMA